VSGLESRESQRDRRRAVFAARCDTARFTPNGADEGALRARRPQATLHGELFDFAVSLQGDASASEIDAYGAACTEEAI
jgi:hypothetical protein